MLLLYRLVNFNDKKEQKKISSFVYFLLQFMMKNSTLNIHLFTIVPTMVLPTYQTTT